MGRKKNKKSSKRQNKVIFRPKQKGYLKTLVAPPSLAMPDGRSHSITVPLASPVPADQQSLDADELADTFAGENKFGVLATFQEETNNEGKSSEVAQEAALLAGASRHSSRRNPKSRKEFRHLSTLGFTVGRSSTG